jgi:hypothetical protein
MRELLVYKSYFWDFYNEQTEEVKEKIGYVLEVVSIIKGYLSSSLNILKEQKGYMK